MSAPDDKKLLYCINHTGLLLVGWLSNFYRWLYDMASHLKLVLAILLDVSSCSMVDVAWPHGLVDVVQADVDRRLQELWRRLLEDAPS